MKAFIIVHCYQCDTEMEAQNRYRKALCAECKIHNAMFNLKPKYHQLACSGCGEIQDRPTHCKVARCYPCRMKRISARNSK